MFCWLVNVAHAVVVTAVGNVEKHASIQLPNPYWSERKVLQMGIVRG